MSSETVVGVWWNHFGRKPLPEPSDVLRLVVTWALESLGDSFGVCKHLDDDETLDVYLRDGQGYCAFCVDVRPAGVCARCGDPATMLVPALAAEGPNVLLLVPLDDMCAILEDTEPWGR